MNEAILNDYEVNHNTLALLSATAFDYDTMVLEKEQTLYVRQTAMHILKQACIEGGSTYEGRRVAVTHQTGAHNKVPIPVNPYERLYAFPTHSPRLHECNWIFYHQIRAIHPHPRNANQSIITFHNNTSLRLDISYNVLQKQMQRTSYCIVRFSHQLSHKSSAWETDLFG